MGQSFDNSVVDGSDRRVAIVAARFNSEITTELVAGARAALLESGVVAEDIQEYWVPGAFELAPTCRQVLALGPEIDAVVALGAVVRGETPHFDYVSRAVTDGLQTLANEVNVPVAFGVLTTDDVAQARARSRRDEGDKGGETARAALAQAELYERLREGRTSAVRGFRLP